MYCIPFGARLVQHHTLLHDRGGDEADANLGCAGHLGEKVHCCLRGGVRFWRYNTERKNKVDLKCNSLLVNSVPCMGGVPVDGTPPTIQSYNPFRGLHLIYPTPASSQSKKKKVGK